MTSLKKMARLPLSVTWLFRVTVRAIFVNAFSVGATRRYRPSSLPSRHTWYVSRCMTAPHTGVNLPCTLLHHSLQIMCVYTISSMFKLHVSLRAVNFQFGERFSSCGAQCLFLKYLPLIYFMEEGGDSAIGLTNSRGDRGRRCDLFNWTQDFEGGASFFWSTIPRVHHLPIVQALICRWSVFF